MEDDLVGFWSVLDGAVHPEDAAFFERRPDVAKLFQRNFVPSAFFGDLAHAPVVLCFGNGGSEDGQPFYNTPALEAELLAHIRNPSPVDPTHFFDYFKDQWFTPLISSGEAVLVNAVAYRSENMDGLSPQNTKDIPSVKRARGWIARKCDEASTGQGLVVFHRWRLWGVQPNQENRGVVFSKSPASKHLPNEVRIEILRYLNDGHQPATQKG